MSYQRRRSKDDSDIVARSTNQVDSSTEPYHTSEPSLTEVTLNQRKPESSLCEFSILLVEDNLVNQKVAKQLRKAGCTVKVANHGGEAVDFLLRMYGREPRYTCKDDPFNPSNQRISNNSLAPSPGYSTPVDKSRSPSISIDPLCGTFPQHLDCILMDWEMSVLDGLEATKQIRNLEREEKIGYPNQRKHFVLGITANARSEQIQRAKQAGVDEVVPKPFKVADILARIEEELSRTRMKNEKGIQGDEEVGNDLLIPEGYLDGFGFYF